MHRVRHPGQEGAVLMSEWQIISMVAVAMFGAAASILLVKRWRRSDREWAAYFDARKRDLDADVEWRHEVIKSFRLAEERLERLEHPDR